MKPIDFDAHFTDALNEWIEKNSAKRMRPEEMEDAAPEFYLQWLDTPADWLEGATPNAYFDRYTDAAELTKLLTEYVREEVPVPDPLLNRLEELGEEEPLLKLVRDGEAPAEARMYAMDLLRQMESTAPMVDYIRWQVEREQDEELLDNALESLRVMGDAVFRPAKVAFLAADDAGREALLDVLADAPGDDDVLNFALKQFHDCKDKRALYAGYLGKIGDDRALEPLMDAAEGDDISYIDFIEVRSAIERLGGDAPVRDFANDPTYAAVKRLQKR
ncbi:MAG: hypothetical protein PHY64_03975 [Eubacteriales bacterium]|nr:hypothetical protein [Eubacteriales bacterium]